MKAKVLQSFIDRVNRKVYRENDTINVTKKRFKEINNTIHGRLIELIEEDDTDEQSNRYNVKADE